MKTRLAATLLAFAALGASRADASGEFVFPLSGPLTSDYNSSRPYGNHAALDIAAPTGTTIRAARGGRVSHAGWNGGYGLLVIVDHGGGYQTYYAHCSTINARVGQSVQTLDPLALVGSTGNSSGPHLHFEIRRNGQKLFVPGSVGSSVSGGAHIPYTYGDLGSAGGSGPVPNDVVPPSGGGGGGGGGYSGGGGGGGSTYALPAPSVPPELAGVYGGSAGGNDHTVASGDTLSGIAERYGLDLSVLVALNPQIANPNLIFPGQAVNVVGAGDWKDWIMAIAAKTYEKLVGEALPAEGKESPEACFKEFKKKDKTKEGGSGPRGALVFFADGIAISNGDGTVLTLSGGRLNPSVPIAELGSPLGWVDPSQG